MFAKLDVKQWLIASVAVFVGMIVMGYILHYSILSSVYQFASERGVTRTAEDISAWSKYQYLAYAIFALLFTFVYAQGVEAKPALGQGLRYGLWVGLLIYLAPILLLQAFTLLPRPLLLWWFFGGWVQCIISGVIVGLLYKGKPK